MNTAKISGCYDVKDAIKSRGWKWDADQKVWVKSGDWQDVTSVEKEVRTYAGVRNRRIGTITLEVA